MFIRLLNKFNNKIFEIPKIYSQAPISVSTTPCIFNFATFKEKLEKRNLKKSEEEFKKEIEFLANKATYTLADYRQRIIDTLNKMQKGLRSKLITGNEQNQAQLALQKKILNSFLEEELITEKISPEAKKEIAVISQTSVPDVNIILKNFEYMKGIHGWLRSLKERNEPLPENEEELRYFFRRDRPLKRRDFMKQFQPRFNRKQLRRRMKWGPRKKP